MESRRGSGGPKTTQGKRRSSLNALKHGIYAKTPKALEKVENQVGFTSVSGAMEKRRLKTGRMAES